VVIGYVVM